MIRCSEHSLKFATNKKKQKLIEFFDEYERVTNEYIKLFWDKNPKSQGTSKVIWQIESWMASVARRCAYKLAVEIIKKVQPRNKELNYARYQRIYARAKDKNKFVTFTNLKWSKWSKGKKLRDMVEIPKYKGSCIELEHKLFKLIFDSDVKRIKSFDAILHLNSIFHDKITELVPFKKHAQFNRLINDGFVLKKTINLVRSTNGNFSLRLFLEKSVELPKVNGEILAVDVGINKMMVSSDMVVYGNDRNSLCFKKLLEKTINKKPNGANKKRAIKRIKDKISKCVNELISYVKEKNITTIVLESIKSKKFTSKKKTAKNIRKLMSHWNLALLTRRLKDRCEENRVRLVFISPYRTSQKCSSCQITDKKSRIGELYRCRHCGKQIDADYNAAINIKNNFLAKELSTIGHKNSILKSMSETIS